MTTVVASLNGLSSTGSYTRFFVFCGHVVLKKKDLDTTGASPVKRVKLKIDCLGSVDEVVSDRRET